MAEGKKSLQRTLAKRKRKNNRPVHLLFQFRDALLSTSLPIQFENYSHFLYFVPNFIDFLTFYRNRRK